MVETNDFDSRAIQANLLGRRFPQAKGYLCDDEILLAVSKRKLMSVSGLFCILVGTVFGVQIPLYYLMVNPIWAASGLVFSIVVIWTGIWLTFFRKREHIFVTNRRIVHQKVDLLGRLAKHVLSIPISEISGFQVYKETVAFRSPSNVIGDILIKKKDGGTYLIPALEDSLCVSEALMTELPYHRAKQSSK